MAIIPKESLKIVSIFPVRHQKVRIQWDINTDQTGSGPFTFNILRSGSYGGPFEVIASNLSDVYTYEDTTPVLQDMSNNIYYKVITTDGLYGSVARSIRHEMPMKKFLIWQKIIRDENVMLKHGQGRQVYVAKRKHWGARCSHCWDPNLNRVLVKNCDTCFGTTFEGGFFEPVLTWGHIQPAIIGVDPNAPTSIPEVETANALLQAFPVVMKEDILIEPDTNRRWEVTVVQPTELLRNRVHQDLTVSRLPTAHVGYKIVTP